MENSNVVLEMRNISKSFPGVKALDGINFVLERGSVHALLGENGAGKSTLMKILSGIYTPDAGEIYLEGKLQKIHDIKHGQNLGISIVHQELNLCQNLSVSANLFIGRESSGPLGYIKEKEMYQKTKAALDTLEIYDIDPGQLVGELSVAQQQMVEIAKAVSMNAKILILDEPTSSLTEKEVKILFKVIQKLKQSGVAITYISHKLEEIFEICDEITVIRDGQYIGNLNTKTATTDELIKMMVGRPLSNMYPPKKSRELGEEILRVEHLAWGNMVKDVSFSLRKGEILGISGLVGAGRTEVAKIIFGRYKKEKGDIYIDGQKVDITSPKVAIDHGLAFVTEDRKKEGLVLILSVKDNIISSNLKQVAAKFLGWISRKKETQITQREIERFHIKTSSQNTATKTLSGGNQQKVILGKWMAGDPKILILDEPTRGIDVGAKAEIYSIMRDLAENKGMSIIMISSELPEILGMSDRTIIMREGVVTGELDEENMTQERIMYFATGGE